MQELVHVLNFCRKTKLCGIYIPAEGAAVPFGRRHNSADSERCDFLAYALDEFDWIFKFLECWIKYGCFWKLMEDR